MRYLSKALIWRPAGEPKGPARILRFVLVETAGSGKRAALMCSGLGLSPEAIIRVYGLRFEIEASSDDLKNDLGCFDHHFWSKSLPKKKKWKDAVMPADERALENIPKTRQAIEMHVSLCCITYGLLTVIGFTYKREIWGACSGWLRTARGAIPSIATTRNAFAQLFYAFSPSLSHLPVFSLIDSRRRVCSNLVVSA